jgi:hypothetical protein
VLGRRGTLLLMTYAKFLIFITFLLCINLSSSTSCCDYAKTLAFFCPECYGLIATLFATYSEQGMCVQRANPAAKFRGKVSC